MSFSEKLGVAQARANSWLCIGLDTDPSKILGALRGDDDAIVQFNRAIVDATHDLVCAYKPNLAFYLAHGHAGIDALERTIQFIPRDIPVLLDAKFGDIETSARGYAHFAFDVLGADAVTLNPYLGADALTAFLAYDNRAVFLLAHTSNPTSRDFQDAPAGPEPLFIRVARYATTLKGAAEIGLVVGATFPEQLREARLANPQAVFLIPGVGAQGGGIAQAAAFGTNDAGIHPLINSSRSILYAGNAAAGHGQDLAQAARIAAIKIRDEIRSCSQRTKPFQLGSSDAKEDDERT